MPNNKEIKEQENTNEKNTDGLDILKAILFSDVENSKPEDIKKMKSEEIKNIVENFKKNLSKDIDQLNNELNKLKENNKKLKKKNDRLYEKTKNNEEKVKNITEKVGNIYIDIIQLVSIVVAILSLIIGNTIGVLILRSSVTTTQLLGSLFLINGIVLTGILFLIGLIKIFFFEKSIEYSKHKIIIGIPICFQFIGFAILLFHKFS